MQLSEYIEYLQTQFPQFSQEEKNALLEKIQELENEIQNILKENQEDSDNEVLDEELDLEIPSKELVLKKDVFHL